MGTEGEKAALVSGRGLYTEENGNSRENVNDGLDSERQIPSQPHTVFGQFHEDALTQVGFGSYQWWICVTVGLCYMADSVQVFITPYIEPSIQAEMCLDDNKTRWLTGIVLLGMLFGSLSCPLADHIGRKSLLMFALTIHIIFNIATAFSPTFGMFMVTRFGSSFGIGVCYPVASVYFSEFLPKTARGKMSYVLLFWAFGGIYSTILASSILPATGHAIVHSLKHSLGSSWHKAILFSMIPSILALAALCYVPESVRYLLQHGKDVNAISVYQQMYKSNAARSTQYQLTELELPGKAASNKPPASSTVWDQMSYNIKLFFDTLRQLSFKRNLYSISILSLAWSAMGIGYYGIGSWVPGILQEFIDDKYNSQTVVRTHMAQVGHLYPQDMENIRFENSSFVSCTFAHIIMSHIVFNNCIIDNTDFSNIISSRTYFNNSIILNSRIVDTDFGPDRFIGCTTANITMISYEPPCFTDLDFKVNRKDLMSENIVKLICPFIAFILSLSFFGNFKRSLIAAIGLMLCGSIPLSWYVYIRDITSLLLFDFVWNLIFLITFTALNIMTVEAFPVQLRATGFGICFACFRGFGLCVTMHPAIAFPGTVISMVIAGLASLALPETSYNLM